MTQDATPRPDLAFGQEYAPEFGRGALSVAAGGVLPRAKHATVSLSKAQAASVAELADAVQANQRRGLGRAITLVESNKVDDRAKAYDLLRELRRRQAAAPLPPAVRVGVSGTPGAGKSTFIDALGVKLIEAGHKVAVLAVDPSSSKTGGSILGDRTRMGALAASDNAYIRPSPSGNHLGGVARATREAMLLVEAAGYDVVLIETVGVGQSEVAVAGMVDTFLLITLARAGDQLQGIKKGILEMADVIAVNKSDGDNEVAARVAARELRVAMKLISSSQGAPLPPVLTSSSYTGNGLAEVWDAVLAHRGRLVATGDLETRRAEQQRDWMWSLIDDTVLTTLRQTAAVKRGRARWERDVMTGDLSAVDAAEAVLRAFGAHVPATWLA